LPLPYANQYSHLSLSFTGSILIEQIIKLCFYIATDENEAINLIEIVITINIKVSCLTCFENSKKA